jgi:hypothetical protein
MYNGLFLIIPGIFKRMNVDYAKHSFNKKCVHHKIHLSIQIIKWYNGNDPKINRVLPLPQGNHLAKFGKDPIYRTKVIVWKRFCCQKLYL